MNLEFHHSFEVNVDAGRTKFVRGQSDTTARKIRTVDKSSEPPTETENSGESLLTILRDSATGKAMTGVGPWKSSEGQKIKVSLKDLLKADGKDFTTTVSEVPPTDTTNFAADAMKQPVVRFAGANVVVKVSYEGPGTHSESSHTGPVAYLDVTVHPTFQSRRSVGYTTPFEAAAAGAGVARTRMATGTLLYFTVLLKFSGWQVHNTGINYLGAKKRNRQQHQQHRYLRAILLHGEVRANGQRHPHFLNHICYRPAADPGADCHDARPLRPGAFVEDLLRESGAAAEYYPSIPRLCGADDQRQELLPENRQGEGYFLNLCFDLLLDLLLTFILPHLTRMNETNLGQKTNQARWTTSCCTRRCGSPSTT